MSVISYLEHDVLDFLQYVKELYFFVEKVLDLFDIAVLVEQEHLFVCQR